MTGTAWTLPHEAVTRLCRNGRSFSSRGPVRPPQSAQLKNGPRISVGVVGSLPGGELRFPKIAHDVGRNRHLSFSFELAPGSLKQMSLLRNA